MLNVSKRFGKLRSVFVVSFMLTLGLALTSYIDSSFLETFVSKDKLGLMFSVGAFMSLIYLTNLPRILNKFGLFETLRTASAVYILMIIGMLVINNDALLQLSYIGYYVAGAALFLTVDVLVEHYSKTETTGNTRGLYLAIYNFAFMIAPFVAGLIVDESSFKAVYLLSGISIVIMNYFFVYEFQKLKVFPKHSKSDFFGNIMALIKNKNLFHVYHVNFLLNFFFALMIIYMPIFLYQNIGFGWQEIGLMFAIMHIPYILLEIPLGNLADKLLGEKEIMAAGLIVIGFSTIFLGFINNSSFWVWALVLSVTRIGASMIQVTTESYFFKKIKRDDTDMISVFRNTTYLSMLVAPVLATAILSFATYRELFIILGIIMMFGLISNHKIEDTK